MKENEEKEFGGLVCKTSEVMRLITGRCIVLSGSGIIINCENGEVSIPEGMAPCEASREFWRCASEAFPMCFPKKDL